MHSAIDKHHAVIFEGDRKAGRDVAHQYVVDVLGIDMLHNPDVSVLTHDRITVHIASYLKERASQKPFGPAQVFIIECETILIEAQNALLKLLEEPAHNTHFVFIMPSMSSLLPTVRSRMLYGGRVEHDGNTFEQAEAFIRGTVAERQSIVASFIKDKDRASAQELVRSIEQHLHREGVMKQRHALTEVALIQQYLNNRSSSLKLLLEHLVVSV